jgi:hypothetical protein
VEVKAPHSPKRTRHSIALGFGLDAPPEVINHFIGPHAPIGTRAAMVSDQTWSFFSSAVSPT